MQRKTLITLAAVLVSACALPAFAQETPVQTNLDPAAAQKEIRNARGAQLTSVTPEQAHANALRRCDDLPAFYKSDCVARVNGQGDNQVKGSVVGGGLFVETKTTMPESEYQQLQAQSGSVQMPPPQPDQTPIAEPRHHKRPVHHKAKKHQRPVPDDLPPQ
ncbi:MAG: hypothetical protein LBU72_01950 [Burkholderiaceae bacterium]|jgi:hypothetical protein|nr:hypothetical protein [Burkholderiaceae bacterium]